MNIRNHNGKISVFFEIFLSESFPKNPILIG